MPVYNGENYIADAIDSILAQTFTDFELIICDNCSSDTTFAICEKYAKRDDRIRLYRNERNLGAHGNFNRVVELAQGKYFKWAAHDDLLAPEYIRRCVDVLESDGTVALAHSLTRLIDKHGERIVELPGDGHYIDDETGGVIYAGLDAADRPLDSADAGERFDAVINRTGWVYDIFGVMRLDVLRSVPLFADFYGDDLRILADIAVRGRIVIVPELLFFNRRHPKQSVSNMVAENKMAWAAPNSKRNSAFRYRWERLKSFMRIATYSRLTLRERLTCARALLRYYVRFQHVHNIVDEIFDLRRRRLKRQAVNSK